MISVYKTPVRRRLRSGTRACTCSASNWTSCIRVGFSALLSYLYDMVPFYRRLYDDARVKLEDVRSLNDFQRKVPRFDKPELLANQESSPAGFGILATDPSYGDYYYETFGTTGKPYYEFSSFYGIYATADGVQEGNVIVAGSVSTVLAAKTCQTASPRLPWRPLG